MLKHKLKKNDKVMVTAGKDKGKIGKVLKVRHSKDQVLVEKVNVVKRHTKANPHRSIGGGIVEKEAPLHISNVALLCDACTKPTRVGTRITEQGKRIRFCRKCNELID